MPQFGLTMTEGSVTAWLKNLGERAEKGEPRFVVETDKVEMGIESMGSAYLSAVLVDLGQMVSVGMVIATLSD
jgi:2-oxoglutarate dehydrogenase E2 component (dihydrolipoamide succinyltransferase)